MPFGSEGVEPGTGLALSGGGFRATLFHCGALWRLNELGILAKLDRVSSVSGGSITAGVLATRWRALRFQGDLAVNLGELVVEPLRAFCHRTVDAPAIGLGALLPGRRPSDLLQAAYAEHLYGAATLPPWEGVENDREGHYVDYPLREGGVPCVPGALEPVPSSRWAWRCCWPRPQ